MLQYLVLVGAALNLSGTYVYIRGTIKGTTRPNRVTYLLWSIAPFIATGAALSSGVRWAVVPVFATGFGPLLVFISSFVNKNSYWKLGRYDYICGAFSVLALILWGLTSQPMIAIIFAIISDAFAALPTLKKSWTNPETESGSAYILAMIATVTTYAAVTSWTFSEYGFATYIIFMDGLIALFIYRQKVMRLIGVH